MTFLALMELAEVVWGMTTILYYYVCCLMRQEFDSFWLYLPADNGAKMLTA
jgi:hypothetical protein